MELLLGHDGGEEEEEALPAGRVAAAAHWGVRWGMASLWQL